MLIALATVLSLLQPFQLPFGGGITLASMMPLVILSYIFGVRWGLFSSFVYSLLQIALGIRTVSAFFMPGDEGMALSAAICVCLLDYVVAYTVLGFGGIFKGKFKNDSISLVSGALLATSLRYITHIVSGAIFFGAWAEWFFTQDGFYSVGEVIMDTFSGAGLSIMYSVFYNGLYMIPEIVITAVSAPFVYKMLKKSSDI
jgi:thiamine transporter